MKIKIGENEYDLSEVKTALSGHKLNITSREELEQIISEKTNGVEAKAKNKAREEAFKEIDAHIVGMGIQNADGLKTKDFISKVIASKDENVAGLVEAERNKAQKTIDALNSTIGEMRATSKKNILANHLSKLKIREDIPQVVVDTLKDKVTSDLLKDGVELVATGSTHQIHKNSVPVRTNGIEIDTIETYVSPIFKEIIKDETKGVGASNGSQVINDGQGSSYSSKSQVELIKEIKEKNPNMSRSERDAEFMSNKEGLPMS